MSRVPMYAAARARLLAAMALPAVLFAGGACKKKQSHLDLGIWQPADNHYSAMGCTHSYFCMPEPKTFEPSPAETGRNCAQTLRAPDGAFHATKSNPEGVAGFSPEGTKRERSNRADACCYEWWDGCNTGRPLWVDHEPRLASSVERSEWRAAVTLEDAEMPEGARREALALHWSREAAVEHASIASFARASLQLLAVGAPADLVADVHRAALDEVKHARLSYAIASAYAGREIGPGRLDIAGALGDLEAASPEAVARETFFDGCVNETLASLRAHEAAARCTVSVVKRVLERIAVDELAHAELAWRTLAWLGRSGGGRVEGVVREAVGRVSAEIGKGAVSEDRPGMPAHGVLSSAAERASRLSVLREVVIPCAEALLSSIGRSR